MFSVKIFLMQDMLGCIFFGILVVFDCFLDDFGGAYVEVMNYFTCLCCLVYQYQILQ